MSPMILCIIIYPLNLQAQVCKISVFPHLHLGAKHVQLNQVT